MSFNCSFLQDGKKAYWEYVRGECGECGRGGLVSEM